jgi:hypothetical protein
VRVRLSKSYIAQREGTHVARNKRLRRAGRDDRVAEPARLSAELAERGAGETENGEEGGGGAHDDVVVVMGRRPDTADRQTSTRAFIRRACGVGCPFQSAARRSPSLLDVPMGMTRASKSCS